MLHLLCHQGPLGTVCLQQDSDHMCLWLGYYLHHDTAKHGYSGVVKESTGEWNGALLSSEIRVGSVCIRVMNVLMYNVYLVSSSSEVHSPTSHRTHLRLHGVDVNPVLLTFLQEEGDVLFQQDNACPHIAAVTQCALRDVQLP